MPAIFVGGFMGWMGIPLDMMTATLIPMMLGMAVDDTIHFFNHSKLEFDRKPNYSFALRRTFRVVGVDVKKIEGFWTVMKMEMKNVQSGHSTQIVVSSPQYGIKVDKSMFTVAKLEKGL